MARDSQPAPKLPPLADTVADIDGPTLGDSAPADLATPEPSVSEAAAANSTLADPIASEDYVVVDEPLASLPSAVAESVEQPANDSVLPTPDLETAGNAPPSAVAENLVKPSTEASVPAPIAPAATQFSLERLAKVRRSLVELLAQARQIRVASSPPPPPAPPRVMVESENDRLAMAPPKSEQATEPESAASRSLVQGAETAPGSARPGSLETTAVPRAAALQHRPDVLYAQLEQLAAMAPAAEWARGVLTRLHHLCDEPASPDSGDQFKPTLAELHQLVMDAPAAAAKAQDAAVQSAWLRAARAVERRLPVWELLLDPRLAEQLASQTAMPATAAQDEALARTVHQVAGKLEGTDQGAAWRSFLQLDGLAGLASVGGEGYAEARRAAARETLVRMADPRLSADQKQFLTQPEFVEFARRLEPWAAGEVSLDALATLIERYEAGPTNRDADLIAELRLRMKWSGDDRLAGLAQQLDQNYRNANVRLAFARDLVNRMIPEQKPTTERVHEVVAGAEVYGHSQTQTQVRIQILPDPSSWRFGLEASGNVRSQTTSATWPARVRNASRLRYEVSKEIVVDRNGMHVGAAKAKADGRTDVIGVESSWEPVPIVGSLVESAARQKTRETKPMALAQVKSKVAREAKARMDRGADPKLQQLDERFRADVLGPLDRFAVPAEPVAMSTTDDRAVMRVRVASQQQLGANTPRPSAPSDSLASLQIHESAFNNAIRGLGLDGRRMTVGELHELLTDKITRRASQAPADVPQRAVIEFSPHDAVRVTCRGDRVELILGIVELKHGRDSVCGFDVHAFFRPQVDGLEVKLVRDGSLQFEGAQLRTGSRLVLQTVFNKLIRKDQEVPLLAAALGDDPRFAGLMVTQLVIDDGWLAMSIGPSYPERTAWRTRGSAVTR